MTVLPGSPGPWGDIRFVTPGYSTALGIPLIKGRLFTDSDRTGSQDVAIIDENLAHQYWPNEDPIGKEIRRGSKSPWAVIVGVVGHIRFTQLVGENSSSEGSQSASAGVYYFPIYQTEAPYGFLIAKSSGNPIGDGRRDSACGARSGCEPAGVRYEEHGRPNRGIPRAAAFRGKLAGRFRGAGDDSCRSWVYGLVSYSVTQRTNEMGIRMALGANRGEILQMVLRENTRVAAIGAGAGIIAGLVLTRAMRGVLYGSERLRSCLLRWIRRGVDSGRARRQLYSGSTSYARRPHGCFAV
ncbi:MAG: ABC transporter permease [Candidatus Acidiferrales bacterium]